MDEVEPESKQKIIQNILQRNQHQPKRLKKTKRGMFTKTY